MFTELKGLKDKLLPGTFENAKTYKREPCRHNEVITAQECIKRRIGAKNTKKYIVATQD